MIKALANHTYAEATEYESEVGHSITEAEKEFWVSEYGRCSETRRIGASRLFLPAQRHGYALEHAFADCRVDSEAAWVVLNSLFPKRPSAVWWIG